MDTKEKVIKLYKEFLSNEEYPINKNSREYKEVHNAYCSEREEGYFAINRREHEYEVELEYSDEILDSSYKAKFNYDFIPEGEKLKPINKTVRLVLHEQPDVLLCQRSSIKTEEKRSFRLKSNNIFVRSRNCTYTSSSISTSWRLKFGHIIFEIEEDEFNELYDFAMEQAKQRNINIDEKKLDERLKKYTKDK